MSSNRFLLSMRVVAVACVTLAALVLLPQVSTILAATYAPCKLPVVVGSTVKPNVMIIQDMSGSMQGAAYYNSYLESYYSNTNRGYPSEAISALSGVDAYQMNQGYYGSADTDVYYQYNATGNSNGGYFSIVPSATAPSLLVQFTAPSQQGPTASQITFTATGHGFVVGDWVAFYNLSSHLGMNGDAYQVVSVSGDSFTVNAQWNGTGDSIAGQAIKRIINGTDLRTSGVNGTVLNWLLTTRTDAAMKAFIGGRAVDYDGVYYYLQYQGMRRYVVDETLGCLAHIRPATTSNVTTTPTSFTPYTSGSYYGVLGSSTDPAKDMFMTLSNFWKGTLNSNNPNSKKGGSGHRSQVYSFTLSTKRTVTIRMFPVNPVSDDWVTRVYLYNGATPSTTNYNTYADGSTNPGSGNDGCAIITQTLNSGSYSIEATSSGTNVYKGYYLVVTLEEGNGVSRGADPNVTLTKDTTDTNHNGMLFASTVGSILNAQCRIQQPKANRMGVVQNSFKQVRFGFMYFNSTSSNVGKILVGCDNTDQNILINAISGNGSQTVNGYNVDFTNCYPYNGTPTGEAMNAAYNYFTQGTKWSVSADNRAFYPYKGTKITDPYYDYDPNNKLLAIICRKSYVLLVSDGEWNGSVDPVQPARLMRIGDNDHDLRTDIANPKTPTATGYVESPQIVTTYSIFTFSNSLLGTNALKFVAMYGGFTDISGCGSTDWPYPMTGYPSPNSTLSSTTQFWDVVTKCDPRTAGDPVDPLPSGHSYNDTCCKEWDNIVTREGEPTNSNKGFPDNYFEASDGQALERSLKKVLQQVLARDASASAVATVSQQLSTGDTVIRGVFEAQDQQNPDKFLWYGHLEAYWPFYYTDPDTGAGSFKYEFELPYNSKLRCETMPGVGASYSKPHCWDAGLMLKDRNVSSAGTPRYIFTAAYGTYGSPAKTGWYNLDFNTTNITAAMLGISGTTAETDRQNLINWTLGNAIATLRLRGDTVTAKQYKLGDIVYSTPVIGGPPSPGAVSSNDPNISDFWNYRNRDDLGGCQNTSTGSQVPRTCSSVDRSQQEILYRDKFIFVGGNDGMVHAFLMAKWDPDSKQWIDQPHDAVDPNTTHGETERRDADYNPSQIGREIWAYIPSNLLKGLQNLADPTYGTTASGGCSHRSMVDLSNQIFEVFIHDPQKASGTPREWRSVLVGGERGGGDTYFAIDVTDPYKPWVLWEYSVIKDRVVFYASLPYQPFAVAYDSMSNFPMSWTQPTPGRLQLPDVPFYLGPPDSSNHPTGPVSFGTSSPPDDDLKRRHVAFVGGGLHLFDKTFTTNPDPPSGYTVDLWNYFKGELYKPSLIVLDMETGQNLFKYIWPKLVDVGNGLSPQVFPEITRYGNIIPYAMSDPVAVDVWDPAINSPSDDGFTDRVYMGDMTGLFYGVKFTSPTATPAGIQVDIWRTKTITDATQQASNYYRGIRQPIAQSPSITFEPAQIGQAPYLRCIFASGKYEDVVGANDDKTDKHKTSLYNLRDAAANPTLTAGATNVFNTNFFVQLVQHCTSTNFNTGCTWAKNNGTPDCCEGSCNSSCYQCVYDLTLPTTTTVDSAERFVAKPLTAGGYVFATSFLPTIDPCGYQGYGYLYIFPYLCTPLTENITIIGNTDVFTVGAIVGGGGGTSKNVGVQVTLGAGVPSKPVLDSSGKNVIVQMSDGTLLRIPVSLAMKPVQIQGWQEK